MLWQLAPLWKQFQSTYLYKVRRETSQASKARILNSFNPRTYIRYDLISVNITKIINSFNPRTYIRYDSL